MAKRGSIASVTTSDAGIVTWKFSDGVEVMANPNEFTDVVRTFLLAHGLKQKGSDSYAGCESVEEAKGLLGKVLDGLKAGLVRIAKEGGTEAETPVGMLAKAIVAAYAAQGVGRAEADVAAYLGRISKEDRAKIRKTQEVAIELVKLSKKSGGLDDLMTLPDTPAAA